MFLFLFSYLKKKETKKQNRKFWINVNEFYYLYSILKTMIYEKMVID